MIYAWVKIVDDKVAIYEIVYEDLGNIYAIEGDKIIAIKNYAEDEQAIPLKPQTKYIH